MASPVSLGDIVMAGQFAWSVYQACQNAGKQYEDLAELCSKIHMAINLCQPNEPDSVLRRQDFQAIKILATAIEKTLSKLEAILGKYSGITNSGARSLTGRIFFTFSSQSDQNDIKQELRDHLQILMIILQGTSLNLHTMTVSLLSELVEGKSKAEVKKLDNQSTKDTLNKLFEELGITDKETKDKLLEDGNIGKEIERKREEKKRAALSPSTSIKSDGAMTLLEPQGLFNAPAETKTTAFDPEESLPWFNAIKNFFPEVTVRDAFGSTYTRFPPEPPPIRYSRQDEWLCFFHEGWTFNRTIAERVGKSEQAFYFSYNGLSCKPGRPSMTTRLYFRSSPLIPDNRDKKLPLKRANGDGDLEFDWAEEFSRQLSRFNRTISGHLRLGPEYMGRYFPQQPSYPIGPSAPQYTPIHPPSYRHPPQTLGAPPPYGDPRQPYGAPPAGSPVSIFKSYNMGHIYRESPDKPPHLYHPWGGPFDLSDDMTAVFVYLHFGNNGMKVIQPYEHIDSSLPDGWVWKRDITGAGRHVYVYLGDGEQMETTVHPSRFYCEGDDVKTIKLPGRWERRLDRDGGLFFVDHHTRTATRLNPRLNRNIDQDSGLPKPWKHIIDKNEQDYYYYCQGSKIIGTSKGSHIVSKSLSEKQFLKGVPRNHDDIKTLRSGVGVNHAFQGFTEIHPPTMTPGEESRYFDLFRAANKQNPYKLTWPEAINHLNSCGIPSSIYIPILNTADANFDHVFTPREYANALHRLRHAVQAWQREEPAAQRTDIELKQYEDAFEKFKKKSELDITFEEALNASEELFFELSREDAHHLWDTRDGSEIKRFDIVQFCDGCHHLKIKLDHRRALALIGGEPLRADKGRSEGDKAMASKPALNSEFPAGNGAPPLDQVPVVPILDSTTVADPIETTHEPPSEGHTTSSIAVETQPREDIQAVQSKNQTASEPDDPVGESTEGSVHD